MDPDLLWFNMFNKLLFLGTAQDGGVPQAGCNCRNCQSISRNVASIALTDEKSAVIIDATPDFRVQYRLLKERFDVELRGIYLTHAHWGHYGGLMLLGKEGWNTRGMPVYLSSIFLDFLKRNEPFSYLIKSGVISPKVIDPEITSSHGIQAVPVDHRAEYSDTFGFIFTLNEMRILYMPDVDRLDDSVAKLIRTVDIAIIDGTFFSPDEIKHRNFMEIVHPPVETSMDVFRDIADRIVFTHLNHTNPLLDRSGWEYRRVIAAGFRIAGDGDVIE